MSRSAVPLPVLVPLVLAAASWGIGTVISKRAVAEIQPLALLVIQLASSVAALRVAARVIRRRAGAAEPRGEHRATGLHRLGLLNPGASYALSLIGLSQITASLSVLLWAVEPILILGLAWWWLRERVTARLIVLSLAAAAGMVLVVWTPGIAGQAQGIAVTLAGVVCCAVYTVVSRRRLGDAPSTLGVVLGQQAWALGLALALLLGSIALGPSGGLTREPAGPIFDPGVGVGAPVSTVAWLSAVASGIVYYALAYGFYIGSLRHVSASLAASAFYLIPVFGLAGGWALLGERLDEGQWLGTAIVLVGVVALARLGPGSAVTAGATRPDPRWPSR